MEMMHLVSMDCPDGLSFCMSMWTHLLQSHTLVRTGFSQCACGAGALQLFVSFASLHLSPTLAGGVRLFRCISLLVSLHLAPFLAGGIWLFGRISSFVSLHLFPTLSSGVWLSGCLFRALTCLSSCVFRHVSPNLPVSRSLAINFSPVIVCLSGGVRLFRLFAFVCHPSFVSHFLSRTSSVSEVTCLQSYVCLSRGVLF